MASTQRSKALTPDGITTTFLYSIIKQLDLKSVDWNIVANNTGIKNGHAARMRYRRLKSQIEGVTSRSRTSPMKAAVKDQRSKSKLKSTQQHGADELNSHGCSHRVFERNSWKIKSDQSTGTMLAQSSSMPMSSIKYQPECVSKLSLMGIKQESDLSLMSSYPFNFQHPNAESTNTLFPTTSLDGYPLHPYCDFLPDHSAFAMSQNSSDELAKPSIGPFPHSADLLAQPSGNNSVNISPRLELDMRPQEQDSLENVDLSYGTTTAPSNREPKSFCPVKHSSLHRVSVDPPRHCEYIDLVNVKEEEKHNDEEWLPSHS